MARAIVWLTLFALSVVIVQSAPQLQQKSLEPAPPARFRVIDSQFHQEPNLEYNFDQKFESGESFSEEGKLRTVNGQDVIVTKGSYTTAEQDGSLVRIDYVADEQGFRVVGSTPI